MTACRSCGAGLVGEAAFCHLCGIAVDAPMATLDLGGLRTEPVESAETGRSGSRRWVPITVALVLLGAVTAGLVVTSGGDDSAETPTPSSSTTAPPRTTPAPAPSTSTPAPGEVVELAPIAAPILERTTGFTLVLANNGGDLMYLDLDTGALRTIDTGESIDRLAGLGARVLAVSQRDDVVWSVAVDGLVPVIEDVDFTNGYAWPPGSADEESFWFVDTVRSGVSGATRYAYDGSGAIETIELPNGVFMRGATADGLVVGAPGGGTYVVGSGGSVRRVSAGFAGSVSDGRAVVAVCDESLECGAELVDLDTGETSLVDGLELNFASESVELAPGGQSVVVTSFTGSGTSRLVSIDGSEPCDLGEAVSSFDAFGGSGFQWAPDGSFFAGVRQGPNTRTTIVSFTEVDGCRSVEVELTFAFRGDLSAVVVQTAGLVE